ncbi:MAG TPA: vitamin K epoxide reductase family protein [Candidatus Dormibacteraeota bacterium]|jgi:uncharacterized membrane protein|nr:vitamin K epoxide reductase family protein [Candidatus Dormibacteraeota bacterium]
MTRWPLLTLAVISPIGFAISVYLTWAHYAHTALACSSSGLINCELVTSSAYGRIFGTGIPTSAGGLIWFAGLAVLLALQWRDPKSSGLAVAAFAWSGVALLTVMYLVYVEIIVLGAICAWCTGVHLLVLVAFLLSLMRWIWVLQPVSE